MLHPGGRVLLMRWAVLCCLLPLAACQEPVEPADADWFASKSWDDGAAVICVYKGRVNKYGTWRDAEARDYLIREYLDPNELTKRDTPDKRAIPVIKANRHVSFNTGTYDYRLMSSLFFTRKEGSLVKAVGSSQDGCGLTFQNWDRRGRLHFNSYWEGEGRGTRTLAKDENTFFRDELSYVAQTFGNGGAIALYPSLVRSKIGDLKTIGATVVRRGSTVRVQSGGKLLAEFLYDDEGFLKSWTIEGTEQFSRVVKRRSYYWNHTAPGDKKLLESAK